MEMQKMSKEEKRNDKDVGTSEPVLEAKAEEEEQPDHYSKLQNPQEDVYAEAFCSGNPVKTTAVKQTEGNTRLYRAVCVCLTIICLVLLMVVIVLSLKLQTGSTVRPPGKEAGVAVTCSRDECLTHFPIMKHQCRQCGCDRGWVAFGGMCFFLSTFRMSWQDSQRNCSAGGGSLAVISSPRVQQFLTKEAKMSQYWIGLRQNKDTWTWINNSAFQESYWADVPGEGDCGLLSGGNLTKNWKRGPCQGYTYFICQLQM